MTLPDSYRDALVAWAKREPLVSTVYIYGSYAKGTARPTRDPKPSDLDVAVTLVPTREETDIVWMDNRAQWVAELEAKIDCKVHLELDHNAPTIRAGVEEASILIYENR